MTHRRHPHIKVETAVGTQMGACGAVTGTVRPAGAEVTAYVNARDGRWYLQPPSAKQGNRWSIMCYFGDEDTPSGTRYEVAFCRGHNPLQQEVLDVLPPLPNGERWAMSLTIERS